MRSWRRQDEGAATAELALATLLIVPMIFYAMYVGEAFTAGIKAQEAEIAATWEMTAYRLHDYGGGNYETLYTRAARTSVDQIRKDLQDFDSYDTSNPRGRVNAATEYELKELQCARRTGNQAGVELSPGSFTNLGGSYLHSDGYVGCQARVEFRNRMLPRRVHREFDRGVELLPDRIAKIELCGSGNTVQGCRGSQAPGMLLLTDDWGLEDPRPNPVGTSANRKYYDVGNSIYSVHGAAKAGSLAILAGFTPLVLALDQGKTSTFKMGYRKTVEEKQPISPTAGGPTSAHMSPYHDEAHDYTDDVEGVSKLIYGEKKTKNYLGKQKADWNGQ